MSISTGIGLISGIDTATLINQLIALQSIPKVNLQLRLAALQTKQAALLDINARLLNLKTTAAGLRTGDIFNSITTVSSDPDALIASPIIGGSAQPGSYSFLVKQLVSTSQKISRGFTDTTATPVGLTQLSFELGNGFVSNDTDLADLNAGDGVARGKIKITDRAANTATIDLTTATTIGEVLRAINSDPTVQVTATADGDRLVLTDISGGGGSLSVANDGTYTTATDLGLDVESVDNILIGNKIRTLGGVTPLSSLNDGTGVLLVAANPDISIFGQNGRQYDIDFSRIDTDITGETLIEDLNNGLGVKTNPDSEEDIKFVDRDGVEHLVDLTDIVTVQDFMDRVFDQSDEKITITVTDGDKFTVTDNTGGSGLLKVLGTGPLDEQTAKDLGILKVDGVSDPSFDGTLIPNADHTPAATTIQQIIDRINNAYDILGDENEGHIVASLAADGVSLQLQDTDPFGGLPTDFRVESTAGNPSAARDLGLEGVAPVGEIIDGNRLIAGINSVLLSSLNGGTGVRDTTTLDIIDREGTGDTFTIDPDGSLSDIVALINDSAIKVTASINDAGNGLLITDTSGSVASNLIIVGDPAIDLGIDTGALGVDENAVRGDDLELRYVSNATQLSELNYGRGIGTGRFRITDGDGDQIIIDFDTQKTVFDLIKEINGQASSADVDVTARVNDNGDGIVLENTLMPVPAGFIKVESISGTTADDLRLKGQATTEGGSIDGSYEANIEINATDTVNEILQAINDAGIPINATVLNTGVGATPFKMVFSSEVTGSDGGLLIDDYGFGLDLTTLTESQDAKVFFGSADPTKATLIQRSSNTFTDVLQGVTVDLFAATDTPVTVNISRDTATIEEKISEFVAAFNDAIQRIDQYDFFDVDAEARGPLLGNSTTAQVRGALIRVVQGRATGVQTQFQFLSQVGIRIGANSNLTFDRARFQEALDEDYDAVENLFTAFESSTTTTQEILEGVTVTVNNQTFASLGFADLFDQLLDGLTNSIDGTVTIADQSFQSQIDLTNDRIEQFDERLDAKRDVLERQFVALEIALAGLQAQQNGLLSLINNLAISQLSLR